MFTMASVLKPNNNNNNNTRGGGAPNKGILSLYIEFPVSHQFETLNDTQWMGAHLR